MKKSLIALAVLGLSGIAMAQSSVTLYGAADAGVGKIKAADAMSDGSGSGSDASNKTQFISGSLMNNTDSYLGVRGSEDMGNGLKAGFHFESGLNLNDGRQTDGAFWARQAYMWVAGGWGTFTLGRQFTTSYSLTRTYDLTGTANYSVLGNTYDYVGGGIRADSAYGYISPTFNGFTAWGGIVRKADVGINAWDVAGSYSSGPIVAGLSINKSSGGKTSYQLGGKYNFGSFTLAASYTDAARPATHLVRRGFEVGGSVTFGAFSATLDLTRDTRNDWTAKKYTNGVAELKYALSKRTFLYAAYLRLDKTNNYGLGINHTF